MGWYYTNGGSRRDVIAECIEDRTHAKAIRHCTSGNCLWIVWECNPDHPQAGERWITLDIMVPHRDGWGYKPLDESCGPVYYSCPLAYLELAPEVNPGWRANVRQYWKDRAARRKKKT